MENLEHLAILKQGVKIWNQWREDNPDIRPELRRAYFAGGNLEGVNLKKADLREAYISKTNLRYANFFQADLYAANLLKTDLRGADLRRARLFEVILSQALLCEAEFKEAQFYETVFGDADLSDAKGLDYCYHHGPSTIDHRTLAKSGQLPLAFLRGCGLPDVLINYLPTLLNEPFQFYSCFISYSHQDEVFARRLYDALQSNGIRCWYAPEDIQGGKKLHEQIDEAIKIHDKLLLVLSEHSMNSEWVKTELANARRREVNENKRLLFPIRLVDYEVVRDWSCFDADTGKDSAREIREFYIPDFSNWKDHDSFEQEFAKLIRDLKADKTKGNE